MMFVMIIEMRVSREEDEIVCGIHSAKTSTKLARNPDFLRNTIIVFWVLPLFSRYSRVTKRGLERTWEISPD